jgi:hypothetical protein
MTTVKEIYQQVCFALLENGRLTLGVCTDAQFLHSLAVVLLDFSLRTRIDKSIFNTQIQAGVSQYTVPDSIMAPGLCFAGARIIERVSEADLRRGHHNWKNRSGPPQQWHEDDLDIKRLQLFPTPVTNGAATADKYGDFYPAENNLAVVGPSSPSKNVWGMGDVLDGIPDSFTHYLIYGILEQIFTADAEHRDNQRALYCRTRFQEGVTLAAAIAKEELLEEEGY